MSRDPYQDELMVLLPRSSGGRSAYAYAVEGGYTGTEKEFAERLASLLSRPVVGSVDGGDIVLTGDLAPGTYTFAYVVRKADGTTETVPIGTYTAEESAPKTYTIRWCNYDGTVLETDTVTEGETPVYSGSTPTRAEDDLYTYTFAGWDKAITAAAADATYTATYAQNVKPVEPSYTNLANPTLEADGGEWLENSRMSSGTVGSVSGQGETVGHIVTNYIPAKMNDIIYIKGLNVSEKAGGKSCAIHAFSAKGKGQRLALLDVAPGTSTDGAKAHVTVNGDVTSYQILLVGTKDSPTNRATAETAFVRLGGAYLPTYDRTKVVITINEPIE